MGDNGDDDNPIVFVDAVNDPVVPDTIAEVPAKPSFERSSVRVVARILLKLQEATSELLGERAFGLGVETLGRVGKADAIHPS